MMKLLIPYWWFSKKYDELKSIALMDEYWMITFSYVLYVFIPKCSFIIFATSVLAIEWSIRVHLSSKME